MTTTIGTPPTSPETAALDLIVRIAAEALPRATALHAVLRDLATALHVEGALSGLATMADARLAAASIVEGAVSVDPVTSLRIRAAAVRAGCWDGANAAGLAQALDGAATVLDLL